MRNKILKPVTAILLVSTVYASNNPIPTDIKAMQKLAKEMREKAHSQDESVKTIYKSRASDISDTLKEPLSEKLQNPMMKLQTLSTENLEKIEASRAYLKSTTVKLPENEEEKYATPYN